MNAFLVSLFTWRFLAGYVLGLAVGVWLANRAWRGAWPYNRGAA